MIPPRMPAETEVHVLFKHSHFRHAIPLYLAAYLLEIRRTLRSTFIVPKASNNACSSSEPGL